VQFCLRGPAEQAVIALGARTADQVRANVAAVQAPIPEGFWAALAGGSAPPWG
jgi:aryl-alcohol dehydrogenase-like predicted oxidoreductase